MADVDPISRDDDAPAAAATPKKKRAWLLPVLAVVGALAIGGGAYFAGRLTSHPADAGAESDETAEAAPTKANAKAKKSDAAKQGKDAKGKSKAKAEKRVPLYYAMEPAFVVNYQDLQALRFLQVGVQVMAYSQADLDALKANEPLARNALVMLFSGQTYDALISREGKEKLREDALQELRKVIAEHASKDSLQAVYFTSFVMQ
jgi:flagellar FliL protein